MNQVTLEKINATNQKYLNQFKEKGFPEKMEKQLENMDQSYLDLIGKKPSEKGEFSPIDVMELSEI